jgi:hypothetical protein
MSISELIERLESATGPNYALEIDIFKYLHPEYADYVQGRGGLIHPCDGEDVRVQSNVRQPNYTASLDAAVAVADRLLPGWRNSSIKTGDTEYAAYVWEFNDGRQPEAFVEHVKSSRAIALCIAILKAKQAQDAP